MQTDPFWSASLLSKKQKEQAGEQRIPSFVELLQLAKEYNISVIFDLKNEEDDCEHIVTTILKSNIPHHLVSIPHNKIINALITLKRCKADRAKLT